MQSVMNIMVNVAGARRAQAELGRVQAQVAATSGAMAASGTAVGALGSSMMGGARGLERYGKNMQWVGRQIEYNFTLPIALATGVATKWALDNERAMTRLRKVYGDMSMPMSQFTEETEALGRAFRFLSDNYGVPLNEVIDIGATWAQAGAENISVINGTRAAIELQILGEMDLAEATEALIAVQAQYGVSSSELRQIIADLNAVENETTVRMRDLMDAMQRSAGVAREYGVDHRDLAGMIASMVPAAGNAREAGNSLKTTLSRLMVPTSQAAEAMEMLGIDIESMAWKNSTATERFHELGDALDNATQGQRAFALRHIAGLRQVSRMSVLVRDLTNENGRYAKAMEATADPLDTMARYQREIDIYLRSSPQGLKILTTQIRNYATDVAQQLIPSLLAALSQIRNWVRAFAEMDPQLRGTIVSIVLLIAVIGPLIRYLGSTILLASQVIKFFGGIFVVLGSVVGAFGRLVGAVRSAGTIIGALASGALSMLVGTLQFLFGALWRGLIPAIAHAMNLFTSIIFAALSAASIAFRHFITAYVVPAAAAFYRQMQAIATAAGTSLLRAVIPALVLNMQAFATWAAMTAMSVAGAVRSWMTSIVIGASVFYATLPASLRTALAAVWGFAASSAAAIWSFFLPALSAAGTAIARFGGRYLWQLLTTPGAITVAMVNFAHAMKPLATMLSAPFGAALSFIVNAIGAGLIPAFSNAVRAAGLWAWGMAQSAITTARVFVTQFFTTVALGLANLQTSLIVNAASFFAWSRSTIASAALAARSFLTLVALQMRQALVRLGWYLYSAAAAAAAWATTMVASAAVAARAWIVGLVPSIINAVRILVFRIQYFFAAVLIPFLRGASVAILRALMGPWGLLATAIAVAMYAFRDQINDAVNWVLDRFHLLPGGIADAMRRVVDVIRSAARAVFDVLGQMLNPFSGMQPQVTPPNPSIPVEARASGGPVRRGQQYLVGEKGPEFFVPDSNGAIIPANATRAMQAGAGAQRSFQSATAGARRSFDNARLSEMRSDVTAVSPGAGGSFDALVASIRTLEAAMARMSSAVAHQERVVAAWETRLNQANRTVEAAEQRLDNLRKRAEALSDALSAAQDGLDTLANMPIRGMREMEDAIWANEMAQKRLRLALLDLEEAEGPVDDLARKFAALQGDIEMLSGRRNDLRLAGAGSDVLGAYDAEIDAARAAQRALSEAGDGGGGPASEVEKLQAELARLRTEAERMDLEQSLKFDPLTRQIERMVDGYKEMPFESIVSGITRQQAEVARLTAAYDQASAAVREQEKVVEQAQVARDAVQQRYDRERDALETLTSAYSDMQQQVRDLNSELEGFASQAASALAEAERARKAAEDAKKAQKEAKDAGVDGDDVLGEWGDFDIPGGDIGLAREEGNIDDLLAEWANEDMFQDVFGEFDLFKPLREAWNRFTSWFSDKWNTFASWFLGLSFGGGDGLFDSLRIAWNKVLGWFQDDGALSGLWTGILGAVDRVTEGLERMWGWLEGPLRRAWDLVYTTVVNFIDNVRDQWNTLWENIGGEGGTLRRAMDFIGGAIEGIVNVVMTAFEYIFVIFVSAFHGLLAILEPIFDGIVAGFDAFMTFIRGIIETVLALIAGDWEAAWNGVLTILGGIWDGILAIVDTAVGVFVGIFEGILTFLIGLWTRIWNWLVGNSIIPDIVNGIVEWFTRLRDRAKELWDKVRDFIMAPIRAVADWLSSTWTTVSNWLTDSWEGIRSTAKEKWENLRTNISNAITTARDTVLQIVDNIRTWIAERWEAIRSNAAEIWTRLKNSVLDQVRALRDLVMTPIEAIRTFLSDKWESMRRTATDVWDGIRSSLDRTVERIKDSFQTVVDSIGRIWNNIKNKVRAPIAAAVNVAINPMIRGINRVTGLVGLPEISQLTIPQFHRGGVVGEQSIQRNIGRHPLKRDEELAVLRQGERVLTEQERLTFEGDPAMRYAEVGGPFDWVKGVASGIARRARNLIADTVRPLVNRALDALTSFTGSDTGFGRIVAAMARRAGQGALDWLRGSEDALPVAPELGSAPGWRRMWDAVREALPFARLTSAYRPGAITATGRPSYHGMGRAVDLAGQGYMDRPAMLKINQWIAEHYPSSRELIYSGAGARQLHNGRPFHYTGITRSNHFDHVHWAMDQGGFLMPGLNPPIYNGLGRSEIVTPERLLRTIFREELRSHSGGDGDTNIHFHGDLSFPNIEDGDDAEELIENLTSLARR